MSLLRPKPQGNFFQNVILFSNIVPYNCNISVWSGSRRIMVSTGFQKKIQALFKDFFKDIFALFKDIFIVVPGVSQ